MLIGKTRTDYGTLKFFKPKFSTDISKADILYVKVDSNSIKRYYTFSPDRIVMLDEKRKNCSFIAEFQNIEKDYDNSVFRPFSIIDSLVFDRAQALLRDYKFTGLTKIKNVKGYIIEVTYYHGYPKNKKFKPF